MRSNLVKMKIPVELLVGSIINITSKDITNTQQEIFHCFTTSLFLYNFTLIRSPPFFHIFLPYAADRVRCINGAKWGFKITMDLVHMRGKIGVNPLRFKMG